MEPEAHAPNGHGSAARPCDGCGTTNLSTARFCKQCGSSLSPPDACPDCRTQTPKDARFCPNCGVKLVGLRPIRESIPFSAIPATPLSAAPAPAPAAPPDAARAELAALADNLPKAQARKSNIAGNVLLFAAACSVFLVITYAVNKDEKKVMSPFQGGPALSAEARPPASQMAQGAAPMAAGAAQAAGETPSGEPIRGTIKIDGNLAGSAPSGTVFLIVRMSGMPDRGPPVAVKKLDNPSFPLSFEVGPGDVMMQGVPFSGPFDVYARLDADGNAMTKAPGDLTVQAPKSGVKPGATDVEIVLDKRL